MPNSYRIPVVNLSYCVHGPDTDTYCNKQHDFKFINDLYSLIKRNNTNNSSIYKCDMKCGNTAANVAIMNSKNRDKCYVLANICKSCPIPKDAYAFGETEEYYESASTNINHHNNSAGELSWFNPEHSSVSAFQFLSFYPQPNSTTREDSLSGSQTTLIGEAYPASYDNDGELNWIHYTSAHFLLPESSFALNSNSFQSESLFRRQDSVGITESPMPYISNSHDSAYDSMDDITDNIRESAERLLREANINENNFTYRPGSPPYPHTPRG